MSTLTDKIEALATDLAFTENALQVTLADGRENSAPLEGFPRLRSATAEQRAHWRLIGDGLVVHWPEIDGHIEVESLLAI